MWTSGGEHEISENIVHMTLARIEGAPPGGLDHRVEGLSAVVGEALVACELFGVEDAPQGEIQVARIDERRRHDVRPPGSRRRR
jgi:hypothetical protein